MRIDFFRGLALLFIFIDHIPGNSWANYTLKNFGFCDASEVFVFLSGYAAMLAYGRVTTGYDEIATRAYRRAMTVYTWHIGVFVVSAAMLFSASSMFSNADYVGNIALGRLAENSFDAIVGALTLTYQPNQMNILPLYVVLLLWFPVIAMLLRRNTAAALALSICLWAIAKHWSLNFPANQQADGWYFNPLTWQLLFTTGAAAAIVRRPTSELLRGGLLGASIAYLIFGFVNAAPWNLYAWAPDGRIIPYGALGDISKGYLSIWRYLNILALAYVVAEAVPMSASFLRMKWSKVIVACGQTSLQIFALGTVLTFAGWIALTELPVTEILEAVVNLGGISAMAATAVYLVSQKRRLGSVSHPEPSVLHP